MNLVFFSSGRLLLESLKLFGQLAGLALYDSDVIITVTTIIIVNTTIIIMVIPTNQVQPEMTRCG